MKVIFSLFWWMFLLVLGSSLQNKLLLWHRCLIFLTMRLLAPLWFVTTPTLTVVQLHIPFPSSFPVPFPIPLLFFLSFSSFLPPLSSLSSVESNGVYYAASSSLKWGNVVPSYVHTTFAQCLVFLFPFLVIIIMFRVFVCLILRKFFSTHGIRGYSDILYSSCGFSPKLLPLCSKCLYYICNA